MTLIGSGGMGEVYRARDIRLGREVALKVLPATFADDPDRLRRFEEEARVVAALNHPNILAIYDVGTHADLSPYLVSELLEGESLRQRLEGGLLPPRKAIEYGIQIAQGLSAAHEKGIAHRDVKPENLFITKDGRVKILDFGLAKLPEAASVAETVGPAVLTQIGTLLERNFLRMARRSCGCPSNRARVTSGSPMPTAPIRCRCTNFPGIQVGSPRWSPDGTRIVFDAYAHGSSDIYIVGSEGGKIRAVTSEPSNDIRPSWSIDGKWIYFGSNRSGRFEVWRAPAEGGAAVQVTHDGGGEAFSSPDGRSLFYTKAPVGPLWKQPIGGGVEERVPANVRGSMWGFAGSDLYWLAPASSDSVATIFVLHLSTGRREELYRFPKDLPLVTYGNPFAVSPDARSFLINLIDRNDRDLMLVEDFR